jgi:hypothetical protein
MHLICWADRRGLISFGTFMPADMRAIAQGEAAPLLTAISAAARHARDSAALFVPGLPEAADDAAAELAVKLFARGIAKRLGYIDPDEPLMRGDRVSVAHEDWERGLVELKGEVKRELSPTHVSVQLDDGLMVAVPRVSCALILRERSAA